MGYRPSVRSRYWQSSFFACLWTETESKSINTQRKNEAILTEQAWSIKDLLYGFGGIFLRDKAVGR